MSAEANNADLNHVARLEAKETPQGSECHLHLYYNVSRLDESRRLLMLQFTMKAIAEIEHAIMAMPESEVRLQLARAKGKFIHLSKDEVRSAKDEETSSPDT